MSVLSKLVLSLCALAVVGAPFAVAQDVKSKPPSPLIMDPNKPAEFKPATRATVLPPLVFKNKLPDAPVATIDGKAVTQEEMLRYLIKGNWATVVQTLILVNMLDIEMKKANITLTEEEIRDEQDKILQKIAPGKTVEEVRKLNVFSESEMRRQAWLARGWDKIFQAEQRLTAQNSADPSNQILKQLLIRQKMEKYEIRQRGLEPAPAAGFIAEIREREGTEARSVSADQGLDFLMGLVKPGSLREAVEDLVDSEIVNRALKKADKIVTEEEVEAWAYSMMDKYRPPFDWKMICQFKQTTPDQERERWRRIQAWKRVTGWTMTPEEIKEFITKNEDHFSGMNKSVSHILVQTRDRVTDLPPTAETEAAAKKKIDEIAEKVKEGVDFGYLAEHYSDDPTTAKNKGVLPTPLKKLGGGLDPAFQAEAWKLQVGEVSPPVKSKFGWHLIKCDKITPGQRSGKDFDEPNYREWIVDEYETIKMKDWLNGLRSHAKVDVVPNTELFKLKEMNFSDKPAGGDKPK